MSKSSIKGLDKLQRELDRLEKKAESVSGTRQVPIDELLTPDFVTRYTRFATADEMIEQSGFKFESQDDFDEIPQADWDAFIAANTQFPTWDEMLAQAGAEYIDRLMNE